MTSRQECYLSVDIEADGPAPGLNSMLNLGAAALTIDVPNGNYTIHSTFNINLKPLAGATQDPGTMAWWGENPDAYAAVTRDQVEPHLAIAQFDTWMKSLKKHGAPVFVEFPGGFDFVYAYWYYHKFMGKQPPFSFSTLSMKTAAMMKLRGGDGEFSFRGAAKRHMPGKWFMKGLKHTHVGVDDAIEQAHLFARMMLDGFAEEEPRFSTALPLR